MIKKIALFLLVILLVAAASYALAQQPEITRGPVLHITLVPEPTRTPTPTFLVTPTPTPHYTTPEPLIVRVQSVNIHAQPELSSPVIGWLYQNDTVVLELCASGWAKIINSGYVNGTCFIHNPCGPQGSCK